MSGRGAHTRTAARGLLAAVALVAVLHPFLYWRTYSGDAVIHLVYARNLLRGYPLRFNVGMTSSGETSMGFMLLVAAVMRGVGPVLTMPVVKAICAACLYGTAAVTYRLGRLIGLRPIWAVVAALAFLLMPGNAYTGVSGMENVVFALATVAFTGAALSLGWFARGQPIALRDDALMGLAAGAMFWLRPEAAPVVAILLAVRLAARGRERGIVLVAVLFVAMIAAYLVIHRHYAGEMPYGAGRARRILSTFSETWHVLGIPVSEKIILRLGSYLSIIAPAAWATVNSARQRNFGVMALSAVFWIVMLLYTFDALANVQFARYSVYAWPLGLAVAGSGAQDLWDRNWRGLRVAGAIALALAFSVAVAWETRLRWLDGEILSGDAALASVGAAPSLRDKDSAEIAQALGLRDGEPARLAYSEVQDRYRLNDNFTVLSLDGITDSRAEQYFCDGWVDHDGYLIDSGADFLMDLPNLNRDPKRWSIRRLMDLQPGQTVEHPGIRYTMLPSRLIKVTRTLHRAEDRPGGICPRVTPY